MSSKINLQPCEYARKSSIFQDNQLIYDTLLRLLNKYPLKSPAKLQILSRETIARFYTFGLADSVKYAIMHDITYTPEEIAAAYDYLIHNSAFDLVEHPKI